MTRGLEASQSRTAKRIATDGLPKAPSFPYYGITSFQRWRRVDFFVLAPGQRRQPGRRQHPLGGDTPDPTSMTACLACFAVGLGAGTILGGAFLCGALWVSVKLFQ